MYCVLIQTYFLKPIIPLTWKSSVSTPELNLGCTESELAALWVLPLCHQGSLLIVRLPHQLKLVNTCLSTRRYQRWVRLSWSKTATSSLLDHNPDGTRRRKNSVSSPGVFNKKHSSVLMIVLVSTYVSPFSRQSFDIPRWSNEGDGRVSWTKKRFSLSFVSLVYLKWFDSHFHSRLIKSWLLESKIRLW